jgi:hypothetical protein
MKFFLCGAVLALVMLLAGCNPTYVDHDYDLDADFSAYETFAWLPQNTMSEGQPQATQQSSLMESRIKRIINEGLEAKGLRLDADSPDLVLVYHVGVQNITEIRRTGYTYGMGGNVRTDHFQEGTFILDMMDSQTKKLVWRGIAEGVLEENPTPQQLEKDVRDMVDKLLRKYPPPESG